MTGPSTVTCADCGTVLDPTRRSPCPTCGSRIATAKVGASFIGLGDPLQIAPYLRLARVAASEIMGASPTFRDVSELQRVLRRSQRGELTPEQVRAEIQTKMPFAGVAKLLVPESPADFYALIAVLLAIIAMTRPANAEKIEAVTPEQVEQIVTQVVTQVNRQLERERAKPTPRPSVPPTGVPTEKPGRRGGS